MDSSAVEKTRKLAASSFASLVIAALNIFSLFHNTSLIFTKDKMVDTIVLGVIAVNILFFYFFEVHTETSPKEQEHLAHAGRIEWWLRVVNQGLLSLAVFLFGAGNYIEFFFVLIVFYCLMLFWDHKVYGAIFLKAARRARARIRARFDIWKNKPSNALEGTEKIHPVVIYDLGGFLVTISFAVLILGELFAKGDYKSQILSVGQIAWLQQTASYWIPSDTRVASIATALALIQLLIILVSVRATNFDPMTFFLSKEPKLLA